MKHYSESYWIGKFEIRFFYVEHLDGVFRPFVFEIREWIGGNWMQIIIYYGTSHEK